MKDVEQLGEIIHKHLFITKVNSLLMIWIKYENQKGRTLMMVLD